MNRRTFLACAAVAGAAAVRGAGSRPMQYHLSCGAIGVKADQRQAIEYAAKYGFDCVDADGSYLSKLSDGDLTSLLDSMKTKKVGWAIAGLPVDFRRDDQTFRSGMQTFPAFAAGLKRAEVKRITTWIGPASADRTYMENYRLHRDRFREIAAVLGDQGITFGVEFVGPKTAWASQRFPFIHTLPELRELLADVGKANTGIVLDSWHWYTSGGTGQDLLALKASDVVSVDLNDAPAGIPVDQQVDNHRELPAATGVIDVKTFLGSLKQIGFTGPVRAEPFNEAVRKMAPDAAIEATKASLDKAFATIS